MNDRSSIPARRGGQSYRTGAAEPASRPPRKPLPEEQRRRLLTRTVPIVVISAGSFLVGAIAGGGSGSSQAGQRFADAWERQDFAAMYEELSPGSQQEFSLEKFTQLYVDAQATATAIRVSTGETSDAEVDGADAEAFDATVDTRAFGQVSGRIELPLDDAGAVAWQPYMTFPGLTSTETLDRQTRAGERAPLLAADGTPLAEGPASARGSPLGASAIAIAGAMGSPSRKQDREQYAHGFPRGTLVGTSGLELAFNDELAGQPSGQLLAVSSTGAGGAKRILASGDPAPGEPVKTTIDPDVQAAAVTALGDQYGGVTVLNAKTGDVEGVAGLAFSAPQPPGSTFKIITATAALDAGAVQLDDTFPVESSNSLIGREIQNAHGELCGGTFVEAFANSCNTVFAPLGVKVGAEKMIAKAEAFGFNSPPELAAPDALDALDPPASTLGTIDSDVALGESSIGQGQVLATPLEMAAVALTIANDGVRPPTSIVKNEELRPTADPVEVTSPETAAKLTQLMLAVVHEGTGVAAQIPGIEVAGKTGTAELGPAPLAPGQTLGPGEEPPMEENAWFTSFAPAAKPELVVTAFLVKAEGGGGTVAAPIAREIYESVLSG